MKYSLSNNMPAITKVVAIVAMVVAGAAKADRMTSITYVDSATNEVLTVVSNSYHRRSEKVAWSNLTNDNGVALVNLKDYTYRHEDPSTWYQSMKTDGSYQSLTYGNGRFVAGGDNNIWYSDDVVNWTQCTGLYDIICRCLTYGNGRFVAGSGYDGIWYSDDGINWTQSMRTGGEYYSLTYGNGRFVAGSYGIWYSDDGINWTLCTGTYNDTEWGCLTYGNGRFVAGNYNDGIWYSDDGINWIQSMKTDGAYYSLTYGNGRFVAGGAGSGIWYSDDGINWIQSMKTNGAYYCLTYGNGKFVAGNYNDGIWYSDDGINWTRCTGAGRDYYSLTYGNGRFVAGSGNSQGIWYSDFTSETVVPVVQQLQVDGQPIALDSNNVVNIISDSAKKRYAVFNIPMNDLPNETSAFWTQFELKASTNNFTAAAVPGEDWRETVKRKVIFMAHSAYADMPGAFGTDGVRMYINTKGSGPTEPDAWKIHRIRNTSTDPLMSDYRPSSIIVIVDPGMLHLHPDPAWLKPDNSDLMWTYVKATSDDCERDPQDYDRYLWRPIVPMRWLDKLPNWAN